MDKRILTGVVTGVGVFVICCVGLLLMPSLQRSQAKVETEAGVHLERAARLLDRYQASLSLKSAVIEQLVDEGVEPTADEVGDSLADQYRRIHTSLWDAYRPNDWPQHSTPVPAKPDYGKIVKDVGQGMDNENRLIAENDEILDKALEAVDEALSVSRGGESSEEHAEASRLKGTILKYMGLADLMLADRIRWDAEVHRRTLTSLAAQAAEARTAAGLVENSGVAQRISNLRTMKEEIESSLREKRGALQEMDARIERLERRLSDARRQQDEAWRSMQKLQADGVDLSDPRGADSFRRNLEALSGAYRKASAEVYSLEYGVGSPGAEEDKGASPPPSDRSAGAMAGHDPGIGLRHCRSERAVLFATLAGLEQAAQNLHVDLAALEQFKASLQATQDQVIQGASDIHSAAAEAYAQLDELDSEAVELEDNALDLFDKSAELSADAAEYAQRWVSEANDLTMNLSPQAKERSAFATRLDDGWMEGFTTAQEADARLAKAWVYCARYRFYSWNAALLAKVAGPLKLEAGVAEDERDRAKEAHDSGVEEIDKAISLLQRAHSGTGRHWTLTAQEAGALYMLALFGHEDYVDDAIEAYRLAIKGREDQDVSEEYMSRLNRLEKR